MQRLVSSKLVSFVALIVLLAFAIVNAQTAPVKYLASSETKVKGVIDDVRTAADNTVHLTLKNDKGTLDVSIAPEKFLKEMEITFAKGEAIEVLGSQVTVDGNDLLLAREVTRNGDVMLMRDEHGKPVWVGWSR